MEATKIDGPNNGTINIITTNNGHFWSILGPVGRRWYPIPETLYNALAELQRTSPGQQFLDTHTALTTAALNRMNTRPPQ